LKQAQYDKLMYYAQIGAVGAEALQQFEELRQSIETDNGIKTYVLMVLYQEVPLAPAPVNIGVESYPPGVRLELRLNRPITRQDVDDALRDVATTEELTLVTPDPRGVVGWTQLSAYNFSTGG
jgi:uncharacterized protein (DUF2236 family)